MALLFRSGRRADVPITDANYPEGLFRDFFDIVAPKEGTWSHFGKSTPDQSTGPILGCRRRTYIGTISFRNVIATKPQQSAAIGHRGQAADCKDRMARRPIYRLKPGSSFCADR